MNFCIIDDEFMIIPSLSIAIGVCPDPKCGCRHYYLKAHWMNGALMIELFRREGGAE